MVIERKKIKLVIATFQKDSQQMNILEKMRIKRFLRLLTSSNVIFDYNNRGKYLLQAKAIENCQPVMNTKFEIVCDKKMLLSKHFLSTLFEICLIKHFLQFFSFPNTHKSGSLRLTLSVIIWFVSSKVESIIVTRNDIVSWICVMFCLCISFCKCIGHVDK